MPAFVGEEGREGGAKTVTEPREHRRAGPRVPEIDAVSLPKPFVEANLPLEELAHDVGRLDLTGRDEARSRTAADPGRRLERPDEQPLEQRVHERSARLETARERTCN